MARYCNENADDGCVERLMKKFLISIAAQEFIGCTRKFIKVPTKVPQACLEYRKRVTNKLFDDYSKKYVENVEKNCSVTAANSGETQE